MEGLNGSRPACFPIRYAQWLDHPVAPFESTLIFPKQHGRAGSSFPAETSLYPEPYSMLSVTGKKVRQKGGKCIPKTTEAAYQPDILPVRGFRSLLTDRESLRAIRRSASPVVIRSTQLSLT